VNVRLAFAAIAASLFILAGPVTAGWLAWLCTALGVISACVAVTPPFLRPPTQ
jgi:hypothetical protein